MNKKVIYTCLVGNYDDLLQPLVVDDSFDYICFSNDIKEEKIGVWQIRPIPYENKDKARLSRYVKLLPHNVLEEYDWSLWIDANIQIVGKELYKILVEKITLGNEIYQVNHCIPPCDCTYEEIKYAFLLGRCPFIKSVQQYCYLKRSGLPAHWGLYENNIILRKHNSPLVRNISEEWWNEYMIYTKRDQFSLMYVYWKNNYKPELLLLRNQNTRNVNFLTWNIHIKDKKHSLKKSILLRVNYVLYNFFKFLDIIL